MFKFSICVLGALFCATVCANHFAIIGPKTFHHGSNYKAVLFTERQLQEKVDVRLVGKTSTNTFEPLQIGARGAIRRDPFTLDGNAHEVEFNTKNSRRIENYTLKASFTDKKGRTYTQEEDVILIPKKYMVLIQTDKAIYKAGDDVLFRVLVLDSESKPYNHWSINHTIYDGQNNEMLIPVTPEKPSKPASNRGRTRPVGDDEDDDEGGDSKGFNPMAKHNNKYVEKKPKGNSLIEKPNGKIAEGFYSYYFTLSDEPVLGTWKIKVTIDDEAELATIQDFEVKEYILPRFEVFVDTANYLNPERIKDLQLSISANYTFGEPVKGKVKVVAKTYDTGYPDTFMKQNTKEANADPKALVKFNLESDLSINTVVRPILVNISVVFTESLTGQEIEKLVEVRVANNEDFHILIKREKRRFKPGYPYKISASVMRSDGTLVDSSITPIVLEVRYHMVMPTCAPNALRESNFGIDSYDDKKTKNLRNGLAKFQLDVPLNVTAFSATVSFSGVDKKFNVLRHETASREYLFTKLIEIKDKESRIEVYGRKKNPYVGDTLSVEVTGNGDASSLNVLVIGPKGTVHKRTIQVVGDINVSFELEITKEMLPIARLIVFYFHLSGEIIYDQTSFAVSPPVENQVFLQFDKNQVRPGEKCKIELASASNEATIGLLVVDQSVMLLGSGNDIDQKRVATETKLFTKEFDLDLITNDIKYEDFLESNALIITNAQSGKQRCLVEKSSPIELNLDQDIDKSGLEDQSDDRYTPRVRKFFPETWMFKNFKMNGNMEWSFETKVPDTITTFVARSFSLDPEYGLAISNEARILVKQEFFLKLYIPYAIRVGEIMKVDVSVFHYIEKMKGPVRVSVYLEQDEDQMEDFEIVQLSNKATCGFSRVQNNDEKPLTVPRGSGASTYFLIRAKKVGPLKIVVGATTQGRARYEDTVERNVTVKDVGFTVVENKGYAIDLRTNIKKFFSFNHPISLPEDIKTYRPQSVEIAASLMGDLLGPAITISNIHTLLAMPAGCTEQTFKSFIPNIVAMEYLDSIGQLSGAFKTNGEKYLQHGYQELLKRRIKADGSFRMWSEGPEASVWLTAYVVKVLSFAKKYMLVDDQTIQSAMTFLQNQQRKEGENSGSWSDAHIHNYYYISKTASQQGISLTAFITIAFLEKYTEKLSQFMPVIDAAINYMNKHITALKDNHARAMVTYAMALRKDPAAGGLLDKLILQATLHDDVMFWEKMSQDPTKSKSIQVEIASYALLAMVQLNRTDHAMKVVKWLSGERNNAGGFHATTDTVIGIQALAAFAKAMFAGLQETNMTVSLTHSGGLHTFEVNKENSRKLQHKELHPSTRGLIIAAKGTGFAYLQVAFSYERLEPEPNRRFELSAVPKTSSNDGILELDIRTSFIPQPNDPGNTQTQMAIIEIHMPSGYVFDKGAESVKKIKSSQAKQYEARQHGSVLILYFSQISTAETRVTVRAVRQQIVEQLQKSLVTVYDYYNNNVRASYFYSIKPNQPCGFLETSR